jgi:isoquinoline 1-oxidoreductase
MNRSIDVEIERYELGQPSPYRFELERREFMRIFGVMGGGLLVLASSPGAAQESGRAAQQAASAEVSAWVHIDEDGRVTGFTGKTEIGQNIGRRWRRRLPTSCGCRSIACRS